MCQIWDEIREEGVMMGKEENALRMIALGKFSLEDISLSTGLPLERIKKLAEVKPAYDTSRILLSYQQAFIGRCDNCRI